MSQYITETPSDPNAVNAHLRDILRDDAEPPTVEPPADDLVDLPCGLKAPDGAILLSAQVRELTGDDEEAIARAAVSSRPEAMATTLLSRGVVSIGGRPADAMLLDSLVVGDRDALILGIRKATYGDQIVYERYTCISCRADFRLTVYLHDIPIREAEQKAVTEFTVPLRKGRTARVRMVRGIDQSELLRARRERDLTGAEQDTLLLARCVIEVTDAQGRTGTWMGREEPARKLGSADRATIIKALNDRPGPRQDEVEITCPNCRNTQTVEVTFDALFRG